MVEDKSAEGDKKKEEVPKKKKSKQDEQENELSEEDQRLKDNLDLMVTRLEDAEAGLVANALKVWMWRSQRSHSRSFKHSIWGQHAHACCKHSMRRH